MWSGEIGFYLKLIIIKKSIEIRLEFALSCIFLHFTRYEFFYVAARNTSRRVVTRPLAMQAVGHAE